jgi:hypothetical protein
VNVRDALILAAALLLAAGPARSGEVPPAVGRAETLVRRVGALMAASGRDSVAVPSDSLREDISQVDRIDADLRAYLEGNPQDTHAVLLLMRLYDIRSAMDLLPALFGGTSRVMADNRAYASIVDRALRADSSNAELHYRRAQLLAASGDPGEMGIGPNPRLPDALREARRALALDPRNETYQDCLAGLLLRTGDEAGARAIYRALSPTNPMYLLLHDWERMPSIEGTETTLAGDPGTPGGLLTGMGAVMRHMIFHGTAIEFERRCRTHWPGFRLAGGDTAAAGRGVVRAGGQLLRWNGDSLEPVPGVLRSPGLGTGGLWLEVEEYRAAEGNVKELGGRPGETYCLVTLMNLRKLR